MSVTPIELYHNYVKSMTKVADIGAASALMSWDQEILMPHGAATRRASQMATLAEIKHTLFLTKVKDAIDAILDSKAQEQLSEREAANIRLSIRDLNLATKLPIEFVAQQAQLASEAQFAWEQARKENKFEIFLPLLEKMFQSKKREADYYGYEDSPYDALLDTYEPGMKVGTVIKLFEKLKPELLSILKSVDEANKSGKTPIDHFIHQHVSSENQWNFTLKILNDMGFDSNYGRQDISTHPFTTSFGMEDVRITTRLDEKDISNALYSSIHEGGHALYEQGLPKDQYGLPLGEACSLSIHESQSRLWENNVGRSLDFISHYFPEFQNLFPDKLNKIEPKQLFSALNTIKPSLIRTSADEVTYHFHIMLRFELEKDILENKLQVKDLPEAWNFKMKEYLNQDVPGDNYGCLQDIHWSIGAIGYFPTYSLGSLYAAQFFACACKEMPNLADEIRKGNFVNLKSWLNDRIHRYGRNYFSEDLCERVTGEKLNIRYFIDYIRAKVNNVYEI